MKNILLIAVVGMSAASITAVNASRWTDFRNGVEHVVVQTAQSGVQIATAPVEIVIDTVNGKPAGQILADVAKPLESTGTLAGDGLVTVITGVGAGQLGLAQWWVQNEKTVSQRPAPTSVSDAEITQQVWGLTFMTDASGEKVAACWRPFENGAPSDKLCVLKLANVEYFHADKQGPIKSPSGDDDYQYQIAYKGKKK